MARNEWDSDYYKNLHEDSNCCDNCQYYGAFECMNEWSKFYGEIVEDTFGCSYHAKRDSIL